MAASPPAWNRTNEPFAELISAEAIAARVAELGAQITAEYAPLSASADVVLVGVLKGSILFMADLARHIAAPIYMDFIDTAGSAPVRSGATYTEPDDESDLMAGSDEPDEPDEGGETEEMTEDERRTELGAMSVADLRKLAKSDYDLTSSGTKAEVIDRIVEYEFSDENESDDADESEDEPEDADEAESDEAEDDEAEGDDEAEEDDEPDEDDARTQRGVELSTFDRAAVKAVLKAVNPEFQVLKRHTDDELRAAVLTAEFGEDDLPF